jgi:hypothetical protein
VRISHGVSSIAGIGITLLYTKWLFFSLPCGLAVDFIRVVDSFNIIN